MHHSRKEKTVNRVASRLREILDTEHYWLLCGGSDTTRNLLNRKMDEFIKVWIRAREASESQKTLLLLFFFGAEVPKVEVEKILPISLCLGLIELEILVESSTTFCANDICILPYSDIYFIAPSLNNPSGKYTKTLYIGSDSLQLVEMLSHMKKKSGFEVGAGTGIAGLLGIKGSYYASEIDEFSYTIACFNIALNNASDRCKIIHGDLFDGCPWEDIDLVFSNPPYVPAPNDCPLPRFAMGGNSGVDFIRRMIIEWTKKISRNSTCLLVFTLYGGLDKTVLNKKIQNLCSNHSADLIYLSRDRLRRFDFESLAEGSIASSLNKNMIFDKYYDHYASNGFSHKYRAFLIINSNKSGQFTVKQMYDSWDDQSIPARTQPLNKSVYTIKKDPKSSIDISASLELSDAQIIESIDGKLSIKELTEKIIKIEADYDKIADKILTKCRELELADIIYDKNFK